MADMEKSVDSLDVSMNDMRINERSFQKLNISLSKSTGEIVLSVIIY